jgi:MATE family multidrug resistance protein
MTRRAWRQRWQGEGGGRELLVLALPLIISSSFWTIQVTVDRILLSRHSSEAIGAAMPAVLLLWTPLTLFQNISNYATTFVAQYLGAGRKERVGPSVWQALYFSVVAGLSFLALRPLAPVLVAWGGHAPAVQALELDYFDGLSFAALPILITAAVNSFFAGRGESWTVLLIDATGVTCNGVLAYAWIFGHFGFPAWGIAGAGWATAVGSSVSASLGLILFLRPRYRAEFATATGWRFDPELFRRLLRFGVPNGLQWMLDALAFTVFIFLVGRLGEAELAATNIAFSINLVAILPMLGMGQGIAVLVGQRLGQNRPEIAERTTWAGFQMTWLYMTFVALLYVLAPGMFLWLFQSESDPTLWAQVAILVPVLLRFVAGYSLFDSVNLIFSFALRGAGDTRFVTAVSLVLSWPMMVLPAWAAWHYGWGLYWAWGFASAYVVALAFVFWLRFRTGKWKTMRVIETVSVPAAAPTPPAELEGDLAEAAPVRGVGPKLTDRLDGPSPSLIDPQDAEVL